MNIDTALKTPLLNLLCIVFLAFTLEIVMGCDVPAENPAPDAMVTADTGSQSACGDMECAPEQTCIDAVCRPAHCGDGLVSGDETMVDCGGACPACPANDAGMSMDSGSSDMGAASDAGMAPDSGPLLDSGAVDGGMVDASGSDMAMMSDRCNGRAVNTDEDLAEFDGCQIIEGDLTLINTPIDDLSPLAGVAQITGTLLLRDNESLASLAPLSNLTSLGALMVDSNGALENLAGLSSLTSITGGGVDIAHGDTLRDISTLNGLTDVAGSIAVHQNPVLCQVMVNHFVDQLVRRNPELARGETGSNGADEPTCGPLCAMQCADGGECYGDIYTEQNFCQETCRDIIDCTEVAFCREAEGCLPSPGCQAGQPCAESCAKVCTYPGPCMGDGDCPENAYCEPMGDCEECGGFCRARCASNDECFGRQICLQERCQDGCLEDADCGADSRCVGANAAEGVAGACEFEFPPTTCDAPRLIGDGTYGGDTSDAQALLAGTCGGAASGETVFAYQPGAAGLICADTVGSQVDTLLHVRSGGCDGEGCTQLGCNDDDGGTTSRVRFNAAPDQVYFIIVDGYNRGGIFTLNVGPCAEDNMGMGAQDPVACP